jgi:hypothetical protein
VVDVYFSDGKSLQLKGDEAGAFQKTLGRFIQWAGKPAQSQTTSIHVKGSGI